MKFFTLFLDRTNFLSRCKRISWKRFELDAVINTNSSTIRVLEGVQKKLSRMSPEVVTRFRLAACLGSTSPTSRIYGEKMSTLFKVSRRIWW